MFPLVLGIWVCDRGLVKRRSRKISCFPSLSEGERRRRRTAGDHSLHGRVAMWLRLSFGDGRGDGGNLLLLMADRVCVKPVLCILS